MSHNSGLPFLGLEMALNIRTLDPETHDVTFHLEPTSFSRFHKVKLSHSSRHYHQRLGNPEASALTNTMPDCLSILPPFLS